MDNPLVSVVVLTYNSSETVIETLDSIKDQTYKNIELIITDDASKDDTVLLCENWVKSQKERFVDAYVIKNKVNTGIAPNANRGNFKAKGSWIKNLAADDKLLPHCIESDIEFTKNNSDIDILFSKVRPLGDMESAKKYRWFDCGILFKNLNREEFLLFLLQLNFLPAVSAFINKNCFIELAGYDESIPFIEDWPFWIKATVNNKMLGFNPVETVEYRFSPESISQKHPSIRNPKMLESGFLVSLYAHQQMKNIYGIGAKYYLLTTNSKLNGVIAKLLYRFNILNPFYYKLKGVLIKVEQLTGISRKILRIL